MNARLVVFICLLCLSINVSAQDYRDHIGAGYALSFDGINDYVDLGNIYDDLTLPLTISAWIYLDPGGLGTIFASQDNTHIYNGFHFFIVHTAIVIEYGDGKGNNSPEFRRGKAAPVENIFGKWVQVTAIMQNANDMDIFLNGVNIGGTYIGNSESSMNSSLPGEVAKIGYRSTSGVTYHFKGTMDELRIWNRALSVNEIREQMCKKLKGNEPGLIGYWDFDQTKANVLLDKSPNGYDGAIRGEPLRVYSGAPIGDESIYEYSDDWNNSTLTLHDSATTVSAKNFRGSPRGAHLYKVKEFPSQSGDLNVTTIFAPYYGIFLAGNETGYSCDIEYTFDGSPVCRLYTRRDNSIASWNKGSPEIKDVAQRIEFIKEFENTSLNVDLGENESHCTLRKRILSPLKDTVGFEFTWQDGSTNSTLSVTDFGTYWVRIDNGCTSLGDTLSILKVNLEDVIIPNVFTPNGDQLNENFSIDERMIGGALIVFDRWGAKVYESSNYQNEWDGDDLPSGVYYYILNGGDCIDQKKGTLSILRGQ
jgi:gliding motility-associated-like protein